MASDDWNIGAVRATQALALMPTKPDGSIDWGDIRVCHLDSGYTRHPFFGNWSNGQTWLRPADGINVVERDKEPLDPIDDEDARGRSFGHGTKTLSVICAVAESSAPDPSTPVGIGPQLPCIPCRVTNSVILSPQKRRAAVAKGIRHAIETGCQVVSISLGTPTFLPNQTGGMGRAVDEAYEAGVIVVAAGGQVIDSVTYPGKYHRTIGCGGLKEPRHVWFTYRHGIEQIDVWAPAAKISTAGLGHDAPLALEGDDPGSSLGDSSGSLSSSGKFDKGTGTSYATAHVAAAAAMWLRLRGPQIAGAYGDPPSWRRVEAFRALLERTAGAIVPPATNGKGLLLIDELLKAELPDSATLTKAPRARNQFA